MSSGQVDVRARWFSATRMLWGALLLVDPHRAFWIASGSHASGAATVVVRALGLRHVAQASVCMAVPTADALVAGAGVDALHGLTMVAVAIVSPGYRRPALISAVTATAAMATGHRLARTSRDRQGLPAHSPRT